MVIACVFVRDGSQPIKSQIPTNSPLEIAFPSVKRGTRPEGLEPSTYGLEIRCSIRLSYGRRLRGQYVVLELEKSSGNAEIAKVKRRVGPA